MSSSHRALVPVAAALACLAFTVHADPVYSARLDGAQTLPEPITTSATGAVELTLAPGGKSVAYKVTVDKLLNAVAADVHLGATNQNGPPVVKLFPHGAAVKKGAYSGVLAEGTFTGADLVGPLTGAPLTDLIEELKAGNVYVNVHTNDGIEPSNSGPGDYRLGEIRGQFK